jgi:hypothetical protein
MHFGDRSSAPPSLVGVDIKHYTNKALHDCHSVNDWYNSAIRNVIALVIIIIFIGVFLVVNSAFQDSPEETRKKEEIKRQYILSKIANYQTEKILNQQNQTMTGLPVWDPPSMSQLPQ